MIRIHVDISMVYPHEGCLMCALYLLPKSKPSRFHRNRKTPSTLMSVLYFNDCFSIFSCITQQLLLCSADTIPLDASGLSRTE